MKDKSNSKKIVISLVAILVLVVLVIGITYAAFTFTGTGSKASSVTTGTITMTYTEGSNGITLNNAMPITEEAGKKITDASQMFDFTVDLTITGKQAVSYEVTAEKQETSTLEDTNVRLYLEKSTDGTNYTQVMAPSAYSGIAEADALGAKAGEMVMDSETVSIAKTYYYRLRMWVDKNYQLTDTAKTYTVKVNVYGKNGTYVEPVVANKVCKRATTLHTETCSQTDTSLYCSGAGYTTGGSKGTTTITYGNLGQKGTLIAGDAFDCDVNGDGIYNAETERFYYVDDNSSETATLIYSNNTASGEINNTTTVAYDAGRDAYTNGPATALTHLPTTSQWSNVNLQNTTRDLADETGAVKKAGFSYQGYAARLLTTQEVGRACKITVGSQTKGELDSCNYLMENTTYSSSTLGTYGYWLENPSSAISYGAWNVYAYTRYVSSTSVGNVGTYGVRPAIEVLKSELSY